jgi:hypothetical protein
VQRYINKKIIMKKDNPVVEVNFKEAKMLADIGAIVQDLRSVMKICSRLKKELKNQLEDNQLIEDLWTAALIKYVRCFAFGKRYGLDNSIFDGLNGEPLKVHAIYKDLRDKHIAHSVNPFEQMKVGLILSTEENKNRNVEGVATVSMRQITLSIDGVHQLGLLAKVILEKVCKIAKQYEQKVIEVGRKHSIEDLYKRPRLRLTAPGPNDTNKPRK